MSNWKSRAEVVAFIVALVIAFGIPPRIPCEPYLHLIRIFGVVVLGIAAIYFFWPSHVLISKCIRIAAMYFSWRSTVLISKCMRIIVVGLIIASVGWVFWYPIEEAYQRTHLEKYITVWERNGYLWEGEELDRPIEVKPGMTLRSKEHGRARLTPMIGNDTSDQIITAGTDVVVSIIYDGRNPELSAPMGNCQKMRARPTDRQSFRCIIPEDITPRKSRTTGFRKGPDEYITIKDSPGRYKIEYSFVGRSANSCTFSVTGYYWVEIVHASTGKSK